MGSIPHGLGIPRWSDSEPLKRGCCGENYNPDGVCCSDAPRFAPPQKWVPHPFAFSWRMGGIPQISMTPISVLVSSQSSTVVADPREMKRVPIPPQKWVPHPFDFSWRMGGIPQISMTPISALVSFQRTLGGHETQPAFPTPQRHPSQTHYQFQNCLNPGVHPVRLSSPHTRSQSASNCIEKTYPNPPLCVLFPPVAYTRTVSGVRPLAG